MDILAHNRAAWDRQVAQRNPWTIPVAAEAIEEARQGRWEVLLTPAKPVPREWFPRLQGCSILCLASGGGQQGPLLAAAGAEVTVFDNSLRQLEQDAAVAKQHGLNLNIVQGDMADLRVFADQSFDLIFHPCSNCFVPHVLPVWQECFRVLRPKGLLLSGFTNPLRYIFDDARLENGSLEVRHTIPYSDLASLAAADYQRLIVNGEQPLEFGHTLDDLLGGQLTAGFVLIGFYEDKYADTTSDPISKFIASFIATQALKPKDV